MIHFSTIWKKLGFSVELMDSAAIDRYRIFQFRRKNRFMIEGDLVQIVKDLRKSPVNVLKDFLTGFKYLYLVYSLRRGM